jgi:hypothetical protein
MNKEDDEAYAGQIARTMWRMTKRRAAQSLAAPAVGGLSTAAVAGAPENKSLQSAAPVRPAAVADNENLREFLSRLAQELGRDDPPHSGQ